MAIDFSQYLPGYKDASGQVIQHGVSVVGIINAIPDNSLVTLSDNTGMEGSNNLFKKKGNQLIPFLGKPYQEVINVPLSGQQWNMAGGVLPKEFGISSTQTEAQAAAKYQTALNDTTTPRSYAQAPQPASQGSTVGFGGVAGEQVSQSPVDSLYQKYFGRNATSAEQQNWGHLEPVQLDTYLRHEYQNASGVAYDGSPITPGNSKSNNQLGIQPKLPQSAQDVLDLHAKELANTPSLGVDPTPQQIADYKAMIEERLGPYYQQLKTQAEQDLTKGFTQIAQDLSASERNLESNYGQSLQNTQEQMASRGLTFSSKRDTAEKTLADQTQAAIEAGRLKAQRAASSIGTEGERFLGSSQFPTQQLATVASAPKPILGQAGVYGFQKPTETQSLFNPVGGVRGTNEYAKADESQLALDKKLADRRLSLVNQIT